MYLLTKTTLQSSNYSESNANKRSQPVLMHPKSTIAVCIYKKSQIKQNHLLSKQRILLDGMSADEDSCHYSFCMWMSWSVAIVIYDGLEDGAIWFEFVSCSGWVRLVLVRRLDNKLGVGANLLGVGEMRKMGFMNT